MTSESLTGLDWQLLALLQEDGRITVSALAQQLGRSRSNIAERLEKLKESGVLTAVTAQLDEEKLGFGISAMVRLEAGSSRHREIVEAVTAMPEVAECHVLTGSELLMIRLVARDMAHLRNLVDALTSHGSTQTDVIFSSVKRQLKLDTTLRNSLKA